MEIDMNDLERLLRDALSRVLIDALPAADDILRRIIETDLISHNQIVITILDPNTRDEIDYVISVTKR